MKKLNSKGFTHHLLIFALLALVVGAAGFAGYRIWKNKNIDAQAAGWTRIQDNSFVVSTACKTRIGSSYTLKIYVRSKSPYFSGTAAGTGSPAFGGQQQKSNNRYMTFTFYNVDSSKRAEAGVRHPSETGNAVTHGVYLSAVTAYC